MKAIKPDEDDPYKVVRNWNKTSEMKPMSIGSTSSASKEGSSVTNGLVIDEFRLAPIPSENLN